MGLDFLRKCAKPFKRSWSRGLGRLATPDLFAGQPISERRTWCARANDGHALHEGDQHILRVDGPNVDVYAGQMRVAVIENASRSVLDRIVGTGCGFALGKVERVHVLSGTADVSIW